MKNIEKSITIFDGNYNEFEEARKNGVFGAIKTDLYFVLPFHLHHHHHHHHETASQRDGMSVISDGASVDEDDRSTASNIYGLPD